MEHGIEENIYIPQAHVTACYSKYMGDVDLLNQFLSIYRSKITGENGG